MNGTNHWKLSAITLIGTDTITTKIALESGKAKEVNGIASHIIHDYGYIELALVKALVILTAFLAWYYDVGRDTKRSEQMNWLLPRFASFLGVFLTITNSVQILLIYTLA